ncbi:hypothetical protein LR48_Vigan08g102200 [Vigna angularis]|uniref:Uncharacterized protein n=1 Tax=Phaseolus angularis TaxID=3914 RepID=A0A0L9V525_PHAAN|nr:hypothetical protein LR48_Vigan08g102200 [Vigna angularis]
MVYLGDRVREEEFTIVKPTRTFRQEIQGGVDGGVERRWVGDSQCGCDEGEDDNAMEAVRCTTAADDDFEKGRRQREGAIMMEE